MPDFISPFKSGSLLRVHAQPGAKVSAVVGVHGDRLKIKIKAPPIEGEANEELKRFLGELCGCAKSKVELLRGETARQKDLYLEISPSELGERLKTYLIN